MIGLKFLKNYYVKQLIVISISTFYGSIVLLNVIWNIIRYRSAYFHVNRRDVSPQCLNDPSLGTHHFVQLNNVKLHYVSNGDVQKPMIVFLHGFPEFWYSWRYQLKELSKDYHCVAPDMRGYGESQKLQGIHNYTSDLISGDIKELITSLGKEKAIVIGHDWGGAIAWRFAAQNPETVEKLIILNAPHFRAFADVINKSIKQFLMSWYMYLFNIPLLPEMIILSRDLNIFENIFSSGDRRKLCSDEEIEAYKYIYSKPNAITCPLNYYRAVIRDYPSKLPSDYRIHMPTMVIWGMKDMALSYPLAEASGKYCDNFILKTIENCSHWTQMDSPQLVNQYIKEFLN